MYIEFLFQFSIIFTFLLYFSLQKCLHGGSLIFHTRIYLILTSICLEIFLIVFVTAYLEVNFVKFQDTTAFSHAH